MTDGNRLVTCPPLPTPSGTIEPTLVPISPRDGRQHRLRRLGLMAVVLLATLGVAPLVDGGDRPTQVASGAAEEQEPVFEAASARAAAAAGILGAPSSTAAEITTSTTAAPTTTTPPTTAVPVTAAPTTTAAPRPTTTVAPPTTQAPTTTAAPPTTQAAPQQAQSSDGGYAYDDPRSTQVWLDLAQCEAGGNWAANTGNGYYGGLQFSKGSWDAVGGTGYPHEHPRDTQITMGRRLQAAQGWEAWPHCSEKLGLR